MKPVPLMVSVSGLDPACAVEGERVVIDGCGLGAAVTMKLKALELPPPGEGLMTTRGKLPAVARSDALSEMLSWPLFTNVTAWITPLNVTDEDEMNPVPFIVSVSRTDPAWTDVGERLVIDGFGLLSAGETVKLTVLELPPPGDGLYTATGKLPVVARSDALSIIVN